MASINSLMLYRLWEWILKYYVWIMVIFMVSALRWVEIFMRYWCCCKGYSPPTTESFLWKSRENKQNRREDDHYVSNWRHNRRSLCIQLETQQTIIMYPTGDTTDDHYVSNWRHDRRSLCIQLETQKTQYDSYCTVGSENISFHLVLYLCVSKYHFPLSHVLTCQWYHIQLSLLLMCQ